MLNEPLFVQRRDKAIRALEAAKVSMMNEEERRNVLPLLKRAMIIERVKPEESIGPIPGANQVPVTLALSFNGLPSRFFELSGAWIDDTPEEAMISIMLGWIREAVHKGELPANGKL